MDGVGVRGGCHFFFAIWSINNRFRITIRFTMHHTARRLNTGLPPPVLRPRGGLMAVNHTWMRNNRRSGEQGHSSQFNLLATRLESQLDCIILGLVPGWKFAELPFAAPSLELPRPSGRCGGMSTVNHTRMESQSLPHMVPTYAA